MNNKFKKITAGALSLMLACGCTLGAAALNGKYGDIDNNGNVNSSDALAVLRYSIGQSDLDAASLERADVTGDGNVNSADALDILRYSVGMIDSFKVEGNVAVPTDKNEILKLYTAAVKKARSEKPSYRYSNSAETKDVKIKMGGLGGAFVSPEDIAQMEKDATQKETHDGIAAKGSGVSLSNLPEECLLTDASVLKSITCTKTASGNFKIDIKFKDETNPKRSTSAICKALGVADVNEYKEAFEEGFGGDIADGFTINVDSVSLKYNNCYVTCEVNPKTNELVSFNWNIDNKTSVKMSVESLMTMTMDMTALTSCSGWDFGY